MPKARLVAFLAAEGQEYLRDPSNRNLFDSVGVTDYNGTTIDVLVEVDPGATAKVLTLPASVLAPLMGGRQIAGSAHSARSAEVRVLMAHANIVCETVHDLTPAGVRSARDALLELVRGTLMREFDDVEPRLAPALARAAMEIADSHLADAELSPSSLARELNVSVRTLHRAFAAAGESAAAYVRRRRLDQARLDLAAPSGRPGVSEVAARWHFVDSSHFTRAFKKQFGETPAQFARSSGTGGDATHAGPKAVMVNPDPHGGSRLRSVPAYELWSRATAVQESLAARRRCWRSRS